MAWPQEVAPYWEKAVRQSDQKLVRALSLFRDLAAVNFKELMSVAFLQNFRPNVTLISEGDMPEYLHIVVEGEVELFCSNNSHKITIDIIWPAMTFILAAVIRDAVYLESARTLTSALVLAIPAKTVRDVFDSDAAFARATVNELAKGYHDFVRSLKNQKLRTSAERLANWILRADAQQDHQRCVEVTFDKRTLASYLGMTPAHLSRNLALLKKYGVKTSGRDIIIENRSALVHYANPNALIDG